MGRGRKKIDNRKRPFFVDAIKCDVDIGEVIIEGEERRMSNNSIILFHIIEKCNVISFRNDYI